MIGTVVGRPCANHHSASGSMHYEKAPRFRRLKPDEAPPPLVRAAWQSITSSMPFAPLPSDCPGQYLELRFMYLYNLKLDRTSGNEVPLSISPSGPVTVAAGSNRQFSANLGASGVATPKWAIATDECAIRWESTSVLISTKSECGTVCASGLYTVIAMSRGSGTLSGAGYLCTPQVSIYPSHRRRAEFDEVDHNY